MTDWPHIIDEASALVVDLDEPTPERWERVQQFCSRSERHRQIYERMQHAWDLTALLKINRELQ